MAIRIEKAWWYWFFVNLIVFIGQAPVLEKIDEVFRSRAAVVAIPSLLYIADMLYFVVEYFFYLSGFAMLVWSFVAPTRREVVSGPPGGVF